MNPSDSGTLAVRGATIYFEVRGEGPLLLLIGGGNSDAAVFKRLAAVLAADHCVVTYDPRGNSRSVLDGPPVDQRVEEHADDAYRLIHHLVGPDTPVYVFGSCSGGLIALELTIRHPDRIRLAVAHEPPVLGILPDAPSHTALIEDISRTYRSAGLAPALVKLQALHGGRPAPALPEEHNNTDFFLSHFVLPFTRFVPDLTALGEVSDKVVWAGGHASRGDLVHRPVLALAERFGRAVELFPGGHVGYARYPADFAECLVEILRTSPGAVDPPRENTGGGA
ncbi:alpha/beta hydrolase [Streptomyces sp. CA-278952]|uniref:alpha/beta fold hydrolase n=1 Tax=unclassified Streptomyces TaxID=2593676 RepID=UPI002241B9D2|nr:MULTISPECIES: alpha/beta hydrolase [unclassified Streptomyces]UZI33399.1 alpha/beta hydrolase [Streptomyces sp. VB1]WDG33285.1 alpha/beta hydrolase [Streptomyces sp. CA-278952]